MTAVPKDALRELIALAQDEQALVQLLDLLSGKSKYKATHDSLILLRSQYYHAANQFKLGLIEFAELRRENTRIQQALLAYLDQLPDELQANEEEPPKRLVDTFFDGMMLIKGGAFVMGDIFNEGHAAEKPAHTVSVSDFYLGKHPVTQGQWKAIMGTNPARFQDHDLLPVEQVSWFDAQAFIRKLIELTGIHYRLPSEAEWEYAAREGGKNLRFGNGKNIANPAEINFDTREQWQKEYSLTGEFRKKTTSVDEFPPNALGLHDMSGNVWEWCEDDARPGNYQGAPDNGKAWTDFPRSGSRIVRGGAWNAKPADCRASYRNGSLANEKLGWIGFRLACSFQ